MQLHRTPKGVGDFTTSTRVLPITALAVAIGVLASFVALALLRMIGLSTNLFFYQRFSTLMTSPGGNHLGYYAVLVPVAGGLVIGLMARYGSERIRGHGIPEAIESILLKGSRIEPRVALLKPICELMGTVAGSVLERWAEASADMDTSSVESIMRRPVIAYPDEPLRVVINRMAATGLTALPIVDRNNPCKLLGNITLRDMLKARVRHLEEEQRRERVLPIHLIVPSFLRAIASRREPS